MSNETENYFATYAKQLQEKGYDPIPINIRAKAIYDVGWQSRDYSEKIDNPPARNRGVSLRTKATPAIDVDVTDPALANSLVEYLHARGFRAFRYGNRPKFALVARWKDEPMPKQASATFDCGKIEILGNGQQLVAFNIHSDTNQPYEWTDELPPVSELPYLDQGRIDDIFDYFEYLAEQSGYECTAPRSRQKEVTYTLPEDNVPLDDPMLTNLRPWIKKEREPGKYELTECLWADEHSKGRRDGAFYVQAGTHQQPVYHCTHDSCKHRDYLDASLFFAEQAITAPLARATAVKADAFLRTIAARYYEKTVKEQEQSLFISFDEMSETDQPRDWLIKGFLERDTVGLLFGDFVAFKSFIALDMALHVASAIDWHGKKTSHGPVFYLAGEGHGGLSRRLKAWKRHHNVSHANFYASTIPPNLSDPRQMGLMTDVMASIAKSTPALIVIDTLASSSGGADENNAADISRILTEVNRIRSRFSCAVLIVHHTGQKEKDRARGSYALPAGVDTMYKIARDRGTMSVSMKNTKTKDGREPEEMLFEAVEVVLGQDEDGDDITSLVMLPGDVTPAEAFVVSKGFRPGQSTAIALQILFDAGGALDSVEWLKETKKWLKNADPEKAFYRAKTRLVKNKVVYSKDRKAAGKRYFIAGFESLFPTAENQ